MCDIHDSVAKSHAFHKGCDDESGNGGHDCGEQFKLFIIRKTTKFYSM